MSYREFTWVPLIGAEGVHTFSRHAAKFGDGYMQVVGDGINNRRQSWPLQFRGKEEQIKPIQDFLIEHEGVRPFFWTPPLGERGLYEASEFHVEAMGARNYTLSVTFNQRFAP